MMQTILMLVTVEIVNFATPLARTVLQSWCLIKEAVKKIFFSGPATKRGKG